MFLSNNKRAEHSSNLRHASATTKADKDAVYRRVWRFWPTYIPIALKLSLSIGVMLCLVMFLLGAIIILILGWLAAGLALTRPGCWKTQKLIFY